MVISKISVKASTGDFGDNLVKRLQDSIEKIKSNREMGENFMEIEKMMQKEYMQGREDGRREGIEEGIEQGIEQGIKQGIEDEKNEDYGW